MSQIVLVRPGCTDFDEQHRIQGSLNLPLNSRGERQVQNTIRELAGLELEIIYSSPSDPARSTALAVSQHLGLPLRELDGLRNFDQGLWQGLQLEDLRRKHPKVFKQWQECPETICPPEGEQLAAVIERVRAALERPLKKKQSLAVVVSEPVAMLISCLIRGCRVQGISPVAEVELGGRWEVLAMNGSQVSQGPWLSDPLMPEGAVPQVVPRAVVRTGRT